MAPENPRVAQEDRRRTKTRLKGVSPVEPVAETEIPQTIGRYQVLELIGRGAMGVVYKARDPLLDRVVAVKTIHAPMALGKSVRKAFFERFEREAKAAARISHPAIVTIFDVGLEAEAPFLVMEYLPGESLADRLDRTRLPLAQAVQCARELASALGCAHRERIVHRDVKPANVLHAGDTRWKLADFGIARLPDSDLTQIGMFMGTPGYAPPEAIREGRYTAQADVFAWGAVLYELLCGRVPYEGPDTQTTNGYVLRGEPPSAQVHDPAVPEPLAQVAGRALAHDTARRFANGTDAEAAIAEAWEKSLAQGLVPMTAFSSTPPPSAARTSRDDQPTVLDVAASQRARRGQEVESAPPGRTEVTPLPAPDAPLFSVPRNAGSPVPVHVEPERSRPRGDAVRAVRSDPDARQVAEPEQGSRVWVIFALVLSLAALAAVASFYLIRG